MIVYTVFWKLLLLNNFEQQDGRKIPDKCTKTKDNTALFFCEVNAKFSHLLHLHCCANHMTLNLFQITMSEPGDELCSGLIDKC